MTDSIDRETAIELAADYLADLAHYLKELTPHRLDFYPTSQLVVVTGVSRRFPDAIGWESFRLNVPFAFVIDKWAVDEKRIHLELSPVKESVTSSDSLSQCNTPSTDTRTDAAEKEQRGITTAQG